MNNTDLQQRAINKLSRLKVGALFMEMGTGKTKIALDLMKAKSAKCDYLLWICPCSLKNTIEEEHQKWQPELNINVVGCESIGSSSRIYLETLEKVNNSKCTFIVVDESLKIKNMEAKRTTRIIEISKFAKYKLILNGTPMSKNVLDIYSQMQFLSPLILSESFYVFKNKYCEYYTKGDRKGQIKAQCNLSNFISRIKPYIFDAKLELNVDQEFDYHYYNLNYTEMMEYDDLKFKLMSNYIDNPTDINFFAMVTTLHKYYSNCDSKHIALAEVVNSITLKVVVFVKFLASIPDGALRIVGSMNQQERADAIKEFRDTEAHALYLTYGCGAYGLNLQFAHNAVFADGTFDYAEKLQARARIYRLGQTEKVKYITLVANRLGLEEMIHKNGATKGFVLNTIKELIANMDEKEKEKWLKKHL